MLTNLILITFIVIIGLGTYYQIKQNKRNIILFDLQSENEEKRNELIGLQIKEQKARQHLYEDMIKKTK